MAGVQRIKVSISLEGRQHEVGELVNNERSVYFRYAASFLKSGLEISPLKLKLSDQIYTGPQNLFEGLPGVFADSIPDGWGRLVLDRALTARGILVEDITALERLSYVGRSGMGALQYEPVLEEEGEQLQVKLDELAKEVKTVLNGEASDIIEELLRFGGSSGGARPKILVGLHPRTSRLIQNSDALPKGYEPWLIKFPAQTDRPDAANIELAYYFMAKAAGIEMTMCRLLKGKSGKTYFATKRFDRTPKGKLHMHSAAGLMYDDFRHSTMDYGKLMDCAFRLDNGAAGYEKVLRLAAFNVFTHNRDDHSKNVSFLMDGQGEWRLAPAYDLTFSSSSHGHHSTMIAGESLNPGTEHLMKLAQVFKVKKAKTIIAEVKDSVSRWRIHARKAGVSKAAQSLIGKRLEAQLKL